MVKHVHNASCALTAIVVAVALCGCRPLPTPVGFSPTAWQIPANGSIMPAAGSQNAAAAAAAEAPAVRSGTAVVRGQQPAYGGHNVAPMPHEAAVGPRYGPAGNVVAPGPAYQPFASVQYLQPSNPVPAAQPVAPPPGGQVQRVFQSAGAGLDQPTVGPQPSLPYNGFVQPTAQPPFVPESPLVLTPVEPIDVDVMLEEAQTGRLMFGVGINSDAGLVGNVVIDEQNFDIARWPTGLEDWLNGTAFRGAGQRFRLEALPGTEVQRYSVSFSEPYLFGTTVSLGLSGFYYERHFTDWDERRFGGRVSLGYIFPDRPDLSTTFSTRYEQIDIAKPTVPTPPQLAEVVGENDLFSLRWELAHDTRDNAVLPSQGHLIRLAYEQGLGTFTYPRFEGDFRQYFVTRERPDGSGRHVLGVAARLGVSGSDTPIYEHFFAGGFSTLRGFDFRGASPVVGRVIVGGEFQFLTSAEYRFPLTADDNLFGSFFIDAGTVEDNVAINNFRVTPGFELRINIPALGPVPLAVGFGVPVAHAPFDDIRNFHFFVGLSR